MKMKEMKDKKAPDSGGIRRVAVIAGTPVDTQMGVDYINRKNEEAGERLFDPVYCPATEDCDSQLKFQYSDEDGKRAVMDAIFDQAIEDGIRDFFIYCNSLSGAFDFDIYALRKSLESGVDIRIFTPLQVYRGLGRRFGRIGVMAANNLSAHAIEEALMSSNADVYAIGSGNMAVVRAVEDGLEPAVIVEKYALAQLASYMKACGAETLILGCTHFPYFKRELAGAIAAAGIPGGLPLIDPADEMYAAMRRV